MRYILVAWMLVGCGKLGTYRVTQLGYGMADCERVESFFTANTVIFRGSSSQAQELCNSKNQEGETK
jgi:hypothetical protein